MDRILGTHRPRDRAKWLRETLPLAREGTGYTRPEQIVLPGAAPLPWLQVLQVRAEDPVLLFLRPLLRACRCRDPGIGPTPAARLIPGQRRAGECGDERRRGCAGEQGSLAVGSGPPLVEPVQQRGDRLGVAVAAERGIDMIQEAGAERRRIDGLPAIRLSRGAGKEAMKG